MSVSLSNFSSIPYANHLCKESPCGPTVGGGVRVPSSRKNALLRHSDAVLTVIMYLLTIKKQKIEKKLIPKEAVFSSINR